MPVNTNIFHFLQFDASEREHKATGRVLKFLHQAFTSQDTDTSQCGDCTESCEKGMLYLYHHFTDEHKIEFPFLCKVDLTSTAVGLGHEWLVYGQMPPYYWAFPLNSDKAGLLQPHFWQIIQCINSQLELECGQYYDQCPEAQQRRSTTKLVVGYLRKLNKCYLSVKIRPPTHTLVHFIYPLCCVNHSCFIFFHLTIEWWVLNNRHLFSISLWPPFFCNSLSIFPIFVFWILMFYTYF